jgi:hypothetical protein
VSDGAADDDHALMMESFAEPRRPIAAVAPPAKPRSVADRFRPAAWGYAALLALAALAFWPKYLSQRPAGVDIYTHAHAFVAVVWCLLLVAQPLLVARHLEIHRRLGRVSYAIAPAFVIVSLRLANFRARVMDESTFRREAPSLFLPLSASVLFAISYALAIYYRRRTPLHARFMILTGLPMIDPVIGRILFFFGPALPHPLLYQAITFGVTDLAVVALLFVPPANRRVRLLYGAPAALFPAVHVLWFTFAQTESWLPVAGWFRRLPLT